MSSEERGSIKGGDDNMPHEKDPTDDLLERIRQLEEENEHLKKENRRVERENDIFRKILKACNIDADEVIITFVETGENVVLEDFRDLRRKVGMNPGNSNMSPSSGVLGHTSKKRSLRVDTGKSVGGQIGHVGSTITLPEKADNVINLYPPGCENCSGRNECESKGMFSCAEKRTVVDIEVKTTYTEYRALRRGQCPSANAEGDVGVFPEGVKAYAQYGNGVTILAGIMDSYGAMSDKRIADVINGMSGLNMSPSTVIAMTERCAEAVAPAMRPIADAVAESPIVNCDETAAKAVIEVERKATTGDCEKDGAEPSTEHVSRNVWIHGASTPEYTCLSMCRARGYNGMVEAGVIPRVNGTIIHDCWAPYWRFDGVRHAICNAHILRELKSVIENIPEHGWPSEFTDLLIQMKKTKEDAIESGMTYLEYEVLEGFHRRYNEILDLADTECPPPLASPVKKRGRKKKGKERSLIERLRQREVEVCLFVHDFSVSFDNNLAERAFRFVKTKMKVSGCFRSPECLQQYLDIMSYIDTARKHGVSAFKALSMAFEGQWAAAIGLS